jgi:hypothetical protein
MTRWYAGKVPGRRPNGFIQVFPPAAYPVDELEIGLLPKATHFGTVGWTAMHSSLEDRARVSVYFKSSRYGAFNHSHADQNSFVLHAQGRPLLIDSGFYDFYGSAHGAGWYRQTQAHNAVTFDGGQGQTPGDAGAIGKILDFYHSDVLDYVTGESAPAYKGALSQALRTLVYLRPNHLVVYDALAAPVARRWEWNMHALGEFKQEESGRVNLEVGGMKLCVDMQSTAPFGFTQTDQFSVRPEFRTPAEAVLQKQWHGRFGSLTPSREAAFIAVLSVECDANMPVITPLDRHGYQIRFGGQAVQVTPDGVKRDGH